MRISCWLGFRRPTWRQATNKPRAGRQPSTVQLRVEPLEARDCPSGSEQLFLGNFSRDSVSRYDGITGDFIDTFVSRGSGGLNQPYGILFGPHDGDLYVSTGEFSAPNQLKTVLRFDGDTGAFIEDFAKGGDLKSPRGIIFGPDGDLYVADRNVPDSVGRVARFDGVTGAYLGDFVPLLSGGLKQPTGLVFGPSIGDPSKLDLYVCNQIDQNVLRYDGRTGAFLGQFVVGGSGGLQSPGGITFGPDGNVYVTSSSYISRTPAVLRYQGPSGPAPGAFLDAFVPSYSTDGKRLPFGVIFGPDGNHDGHPDMYVTDAEINSALNGNKGSVRRFDGVTGAFIDIFIAEQSQGLRNVGYLTFTRTDPVTLAYMGSDKLTAASLPASAIDETLSGTDVQPLLTEALARWHGAGQQASDLAAIDIRIANLGGATLGIASGHTIWLDDNAAGWGWFLDPTLRDDSEFTTPGDQGEQRHIDLLSVLMHELGHLLGHQHGEPGASATGVMAETLTTGTRLTPLEVVFAPDWFVDLHGSTKKRDYFSG